MNLVARLRVFLERACTQREDSVDERRRKVTLFILAAICVLASIVWGALYYATLGNHIVVPLTFGFTAVVGAALVAFLFLRRFDLLLYPFFLMILWNPIAMQWSLGGFASSGVVLTWSVLAPFCALMFQDTRKAMLWFAAYLALLMISLLLDARLQAWAVPVSQSTSMLFFAMNLIGPSVAIFLSMMYFVNAFEKAHARSEALLLNILPAPIAERLKEREETIADAFSDVTILFADIVDFTPLSARTAPRDLVQLLNRVFSTFDRLTEHHGLEKIKTIGDAYMVAGGLPEPRPDHTDAVAELALDMRDEIRRLSAEIDESLAIRVGIDTGPVVAGVIGERKFAYDLWGNSVNTASRMESHGLENQIQLSERAYARLKDKYLCEERGVVAIKGKGDMRTYTLVGRRPQAPSAGDALC